MAETYLGLDFGLRRLGVAVGQSLTATATPLATLAAVDGVPDWHQLQRLVEQWRPAAIVVGVPLHLEGQTQAMTRAARRFVGQLRRRCGVPVHEADERLSSRLAAEQLRQARGAGRRRKTRPGEVDRIAACVILETWMAEQARA